MIILLRIFFTFTSLFICEIFSFEFFSFPSFFFVNFFSFSNFFPFFFKSWSLGFIPVNRIERLKTWFSMGRKQWPHHKAGFLYYFLLFLYFGLIYSLFKRIESSKVTQILLQLSQVQNVHWCLSFKFNLNDNPKMLLRFFQYNLFLFLHAIASSFVGDDASSKMWRKLNNV